MNKKKSTLFLLCLIALVCCDPIDEVTGVDGENHFAGYRPVYGSPELSTIALEDAKAVKNPGKIYMYGKYLLVNEIKEGIHLYDNSDPSNPSPVGFIRMLGNTDMAIRNDVLYADHMGNLVALALNDFKAIAEKGRLDLAEWNLGVPPPVGEYFECVDPAKGLVVGWHKTESQKKLNCYAIR